MDSHHKGSKQANHEMTAARLTTTSPETGDALTRRELADAVHAWVLDNRQIDRPIDEVYIGKLERGEVRWPNADYRAAFRAILKAKSDADLGFRRSTRGSPPSAGPPPPPATMPAHSAAEGAEAIELLRRIEASDVGPATIDAITQTVDQLGQDYTHRSPAELLPTLRGYQSYAGQLLDGRATLAQRTELLRQAGWLSLLTATAAIDLGNDVLATANFLTARGIANEIGDTALAAWVEETRAWQALSSGDPLRAVQLSQTGLSIAPRHSSSFVQLCTQLARAYARLGDHGGTYRMVDTCLDALMTTETAAGVHHFVCDPRRVLAHCAAALAWLDASTRDTEEIARQAVRQYEDDDQCIHHLATSRMNLAIVLAKDGQPEEAAHLGSLALQASWRLCQTDLFLAADLDQQIHGAYAGNPAVDAFHSQYQSTHREIDSRAITVDAGLDPQLPPLT